jgi:uncharacterized protein (TIGR02391 family)
MFKPEHFDELSKLISSFSWELLISNPDSDFVQDWVAEINGLLWEFDSPSSDEFQKKIGKLKNLWGGVNAGTLTDYNLSHEVGDIKQFLKSKLVGMRREKDKILNNSVSISTPESNDKYSLEKLHPEIKEKCESLFKSKEYSEAAEKGFKIVRDRLRILTGYERGGDAFGKGKLHIKGAAATHVDSDFNNAVKYLTMSIDMFRNEKSHTSDGNIGNPDRAFEYLVLSSLAMNLLNNTEINS